jgi:hypothetical protein
VTFTFTEKMLSTKTTTKSVTLDSLTSYNIYLLIRRKNYLESMLIHGTTGINTRSAQVVNHRAVDLLSRHVIFVHGSNRLIAILSQNRVLVCVNK